MDVYNEHPVARYLLIGLLLFLGGGGLYGGTAMIVDSADGGPLRLSLSWLENAPVDSYLLPGIFLALAMGVAPIIIAYLTYRRARWSWRLSVAQGLLLMGWVVAETYWLEVFTVIQSAFLALGVTITLLAYRIRPTTHTLEREAL